MAASYLAAVLCEAVVRGLPGDFATVVQTQRAAFGDPLDDVIVTGVHQDGRATQLDLQLKNKLTFTEENDEWVEVVKRAWDTFRKPGFDAVTRRIGVGIGTYNARVDQHYQSVLTWATYSTDGQNFRERIEKGDYSHKDKQTFVRTVRTVVEGHIGRNPTDDELWRFLAAFVIIHFDFHSDETSRDAANAVDRIKGLLSPEHRGQAPRIWEHLIAKAGELIPAGGGATRAMLLEQLTGAGCSIGSAPSFLKDIAALQRESTRAMSDIKSHIHGLRLHRADAYHDVRQALTDGRFVQIDGEPGTGKSALLKELAEECARAGPVLVLKDTRIQSKGWATHAHVLGISADLSTLLRELGCGGTPVLFIDGIDKIVDPAVQLTVNDLLKTIAFNDTLAQWRVVVTIREQNLRHLETWLDPDALKQLPLRTVAVKALDENELKVVAGSFPRLRPLLSQSGNADVILRRPFFLDAMLSLAGREGKNELPATEVELLRLWWQLGGSDRADFSPAQQRRNLLMELAERLVGAPNSAVTINTFAPDVIAELQSAGILRDKDPGHSVVFAHDIYEEWALCQLLIRHAADLAGFLKTHAEPHILVRPAQLLGTLMLETKASPDSWKALYENTGDPSLRPVWQRVILTSCLQSTRATQLLQVISDYIFDNNGDRLKKMMMALATIEVVPNPLFLDEKLTPEIEPADRAKFAHHLAVPKAVTWVRFLDWLMPLMPTISHALIPDILPIFSTWQTTFAGYNVRHCRQIGELAYAWLAEVEEANHSRDYKNRREPFGGALNGKDIEQSLRALFLSSAGDVPKLGTEYLRNKLADKARLHRFRNDILGNCAAFVRHLPTALVDFVLNAFLEQPRDRVDHFEGSPDRRMRELGLIDDHQFYPASPLQVPFLGLLNSNEGEGLRLIRSLCNHSISVWRWLCEHGRRSDRAHPIPITLTFAWGQQTFWGDGQVYLWFRGTWGNTAVGSALMALEQWALNRCENGAKFEDVYRKVIEGNDSVAALGIGLSLCLAYPGKSLECALPLVTCPYLWAWDLTRHVQDRGFHSNEIGDWHRYRIQMNAVRKLNQYPHRQSELRNLLVYFVCASDDDIRSRYITAIRSFPFNLPISYEEEREDEAHLQSLRNKVAFYAEQADPAYFKTEPTPDGKHIKIWNDPPSLQQEDNRVRQQELAQLNDFAAVLMWAQKTLESGIVGEQFSIESALAKAKQWFTPEVFETDDAEAFEQKQQTGAIVGAGFVAARHSGESQTDGMSPWCQEIFDQAVSAKRKPSAWSMRGTLLSMDPLVFATHGYAALLAKGYEGAHCRDALLTLALDPLEDVQSAVFKAAEYFAATHPDFYWLLLDLAVAQCIVPEDHIPNHHSILADEWESEFKEALLARTAALMTSGTIPDLPTIPMPWVKGETPPKSGRMDTRGYAKNKTVFLYHVAAKILFRSPLQPALSNADKRAKFLKMVGELVDFTVQEVVPPFADSRREHRGHTPFEWVFEFSAWCGRLCAALTPPEAHEAILDRVFTLDTETALLIMQSFAKSFMIEAFLKQTEIAQDNLTLWSEITDWVFQSPEWDPVGNREHLTREFITCALAVFFCVAPDFSPLICGIDPGWPHLPKFVTLIERATREFGAHQTLYRGVTTLLKRGGFDLLPSPALAWLLDIVQRRKSDQQFWKANGDDTVELLRRLIAEKSSELSPNDRNTIVLVSDILTDNGVRGAGFLQQELLRAKKDEL